MALAKQSGEFMEVRGFRRVSVVPALLLAVLVFFAVASAQAAPGDLDTSFGTGGKVTTSFGSFYDEIDGLALQPDGKIVAGGYVETSSTDSDFGLARYNPNGSLDTSFGTGGKVTTPIGPYALARSLVLQPDGKIVVAGYEYDGSTELFAVARYNAGGSLDTSFGTGGKVTTAFAGGGGLGRSIALQADGKIVETGYIFSSATASFALA